MQCPLKIFTSTSANFNTVFTHPEIVEETTSLYGLMVPSKIWVWLLCFFHSEEHNTYSSEAVTTNKYLSTDYPQTSATGGFCSCLQNLISLKLKEYLFSVLAINLISKLCKPPAPDAKVKANLTKVTSRINFLSVNYLLSGKCFFK